MSSISYLQSVVLAGGTLASQTGVGTHGLGMDSIVGVDGGGVLAGDPRKDGDEFAPE